MNPCIHCIVSGRVQGVFYRDGTRKLALSLGLTGWTRNLPDGTVEVVACGAPPHLEKMQNWLQQGPAGAEVAGIKCAPARDQNYTGFTIRY